MEYAFNVNRVVMDIEHSTRRFIEEKCPGSTPVVDITSDPRSIVAAYLLNKIFPNRVCAVYVEDRIRDRVGEDILNMTDDLFSDRFIKIDEVDCEPYRDCLDNFTWSHSDKRINKYLMIKYLYLSSLLDEKNPIIFDYHDVIQTKTGLDTSVCMPGLFSMLTYQEIMIIAKFLNMDVDLLEKLYDYSDIIKEHEKIVGHNIKKFSKDLRTNDEKSLMLKELIDRYRPLLIIHSDNPISVNTNSIYNFYDE